MIERITNMEINNEYTIEELEAQYKHMLETQKELKHQIEQKKKEEEELRQKKLAGEQEARRKEVDDALVKYRDLLRAYMRDYGVYSYACDDNVLDLFSSKFWNYVC
jgi:hypothetical protein